MNDKLIQEVEAFVNNYFNENDLNKLVYHDVFHTVATVKVADGVDFGIEKTSATLNFIGNMDRLNFQEIAAGTILAHVNCTDTASLLAINEEGNDVVKEYFSCEKGILRFLVPLMPSMLTLDEKIIRQDCLCYLMERLDYHKLKQEHELGK